jgi:hypothetical protein
MMHRSTDVWEVVLVLALVLVLVLAGCVALTELPQPAARTAARTTLNLPMSPDVTALVAWLFLSATRPAPSIAEMLRRESILIPVSSTSPVLRGDAPND